RDDIRPEQEHQFAAREPAAQLRQRTSDAEVGVDQFHDLQARMRFEGALQHARAVAEMLDLLLAARLTFRQEINLVKPRSLDSLQRERAMATVDRVERSGVDADA